MKSIWIWIAMLALSGCASRTSQVGQATRPTQDQSKLNRAEYLTASDIRRIRNPEFVKTYYVGRKPSKNGTRMHESHRVYQLEKSPRWNLLRNNPTFGSTGPVKVLSDSAFRPLPQSQQLRAEVKRQEALTSDLETTHGATMEQLEALKAKLADQSNHAVMIEKLQHELLRQRQANAVLQQQIQTKGEPIHDATTDSTTRAEALRQWGDQQQDR